MNIAIIILSALLLAAVAIIFCLSKVLKNTLEVVEGLIDLSENKTPRKLKTAYDGKYYPATVIARMEFDAPAEMTITDFSMYDDKHLVGFTIYTTDSASKYYGEALEELTEDEIELLEKPVIFKNVEVYAPMEGMWTWRQRE